ncbi:MAG: hypothetical protein AAF242_00130 [Bacteroidota bacterium]
MKEIILALITYGVMGELIRLLKTIYNDRISKSQHAKRRRHNGQKIKRILREVLLNTSADRVLVIKLSNGGDIFNEGSALKIQILEEDNTNSVFEVKQLYRDTPVRSDYVDMVFDLCEQKQLSFTTKDCPAQMVRDSWSVENIKNGCLQLITYSKEKVIFLSASTTSEELLFDKIEYVHAFKDAAIDLKRLYR